MKLDLLTIKAGDIIFILPEEEGFKKIVQMGNIYGQRLLGQFRTKDKLRFKEKLQNFSHVMLGIGDGMVIHADGRKVTLDVITDVLNINKSQFKVFRLKEGNEESALKVARMGIRYLQQNYRFTPYFYTASEKDTSQFCSRLIISAYQSAGISLTVLPANKVLPLDLLKICSSPAWHDVTKDVIQAELPDTKSNLRTIDIDEQSILLEEWFAKMDKRLVEGVRLRMRFQEMLYEQYRETLRIEAVLDEYCLAELEVVKLCWLNPDLIDETFIKKAAQVLSQLDKLLSLAALPDLDLLVTNTIINIDNDGITESRYIGLPTASAVREMQKNREAIRILSYLMMAAIGLLSLQSRIDQNEDISMFNTVGEKFEKQLKAILPGTLNLKHYLPEHDAFSWMKDRPQRELYQALYKQLLLSLAALSVLER